MDGLSSNEKIEEGEEVECAIDPERPQYLRRSGAGEGASIVGSAMPNASVTALFSSHRAHPQEGNRCNHYSGSWVEPTGHVANACQTTPRDVLGSYYGGRKSLSDRTLCCSIQVSRSVVQISKWFKFQEARRQLAATKQPKGGAILEPARLETADNASRGKTLRSTTSEPGEGSWDFDRSVLTSARNRTR
jgi:hypothetical protein